jgi:hypothetical protein
MIKGKSGAKQYKELLFQSMETVFVLKDATAGHEKRK